MEKKKLVRDLTTAMMGIVAQEVANGSDLEVICIWIKKTIDTFDFGDIKFDPEKCPG